MGCSRWHEKGGKFVDDLAQKKAALSFTNADMFKPNKVIGLVCSGKEFNILGSIRRIFSPCVLNLHLVPDFFFCWKFNNFF